MAVDKNKITAEATRHIQKGQLDKAIRAYERIVAADPTDLRALLKIAELQQKKGDLGEAGETFGRVAEAYGSQGFFLKAVAVYKQMLKLAPDDARISERLAELYQQLGLVSDAMAQLNAVAIAAERTSDDTRLIAALRRIVDLDPDNVAALVKLGDVHARREDASTAVEHLRRAADALKRAGRTDEYARVTERISALVPDDLSLAREVASLLLSRGDAKAALHKLQPCFKADPKDTETIALLARCFEDLGQTTKMAAAYRELARIHAGRGADEAAAAAWRRVAEADPDDAEAADALGLRPARAIAAADGRADGPDAVEDVSRAARPVPTPGAATPPPGKSATSGADTARILGETNVYVKYGLHEKALEHLQKILAVDPDHLDALDKASAIRELRKDAAGAAEDALRMIRAALARGLEDRARAAFGRFRGLAPVHPAVAELAPVLEASGAAADATDGVILDLDELADAGETPSADAAVPAPLPSDRDDLALAAVAPPADELVEDGVAGEAQGDDAPYRDPTKAIRPDTAPPESAPPERAPAPGGSLEDDLAEVDFYVAQGLLGDARALLEDVARAHPGGDGIVEKRRQLDAAAAEQASQPRRPVDGGARAGAKDGLDSVRDVLEPFRKEIAQTVTADDAQTHYDLGIAFREMGLLEDALRELDLALAGSKGSRRIDCLTTIALCRLDHGDPRGAIDAYRTALDANGLDGEARRAVEYDLAGAYEAAREPDAALYYLNRVVTADPRYRDAQASIARLGGGPGRLPDWNPPRRDEKASSA